VASLGIFLGHLESIHEYLAHYFVNTLVSLMHIYLLKYLSFLGLGGYESYSPNLIFKKGNFFRKITKNWPQKIDLISNFG
jgi:hypothetical protein